MTIVPHIHRNCTFALGKESAVIQMLNKDFRQMELTRVGSVTEPFVTHLDCRTTMPQIGGQEEMKCPPHFLTPPA